MVCVMRSNGAHTVLTTVRMGARPGLASLAPTHTSSTPSHDNTLCYGMPIP